MSTDTGGSKTRIGVIGQSCIDEVILPDGSLRSRSLGGILYSYAALDRIISEGHKAVHVVPISWRSFADQALTDPFVSSLQHALLEEWLTTEAPTNRVQLVYRTDSDRTEHCPTILPPVTPADIDVEKLRDLDVLFVNMISGYDISIETMEWLAERATEFGFYIHLDVHALVLGDLSNTGGAGFGEGRKPRGVDDWHRWLRAADSVQMNELEARWLAAPHAQSAKEFVSFIKSGLLEGKLGTMVLTRAERGATVLDLLNNQYLDLPAAPSSVVNTTGSGDVFGAVFSYCIAVGHHPFEAAREAIKWATWNTTLGSLEEILTADPPQS